MFTRWSQVTVVSHASPRLHPRTHHLRKSIPCCVHTVWVTPVGHSGRRRLPDALLLRRANALKCTWGHGCSLPTVVADDIILSSPSDEEPEAVTDEESPKKKSRVRYVHNGGILSWCLLNDVTDRHLWRSLNVLRPSVGLAAGTWLSSANVLDYTRLHGLDSTVGATVKASKSSPNVIVTATGKFKPVEPSSKPKPTPRKPSAAQVPLKKVKAKAPEYVVIVFWTYSL